MVSEICSTATPISYVKELLDVLFQGREGLFAMLQARCDESYDGNAATTPIYVVAGFIGTSDQWEFFDSLWDETMSELKIANIGLHASKCANGAKPYNLMLPQKRREIQERMLTDILAAKLPACVSVSDLWGYRKRKDKFSRFLGKDQKKFNEPHILTLRNCVLLMLRATEDWAPESVAFVFDQNKEFGGRAREWHRADTKNPNPKISHRLGPLVEDSRMKVLGLQAADLLAYAAFRHYSGLQSWQWDLLSRATQISDLVFEESYWQGLEDIIDASTI